MVYKCCAPGCRTGYDNDPNRGPDDPPVSTFQFPHEKDPGRHARWVASVPRDQWQPSKNSRLCARHFLDSDFKQQSTDSNPHRKASVNIKKKVLKDDSVPSQWPGCPDHLTKTNTSRRSKAKQGEPDDVFSSFNDLQQKLPGKTLPGGVTSSLSPTSVSVFSITSANQPVVQYCVRISDTLIYEMWCGGREIALSDCTDSSLFALGPKIKSYLHLCNVLEYLKTQYNTDKVRTERDIISDIVQQLENPLFSENPKVQFLKEQLSLLYNSVRTRRYSMSLMALAIIWQHTSPAAYRQILADGVLTLPTVRRIQQLSTAVTVDLELSSATVAYLSAKLSKLIDKDKVVSLLIDEVHCKKNVEYSNGQFYGIENGLITKTLLCMMVKSVAGRYSNIVSMSPVSNLDAEQIYEIWKNVMKTLARIGYRVVLTMTDGISTNIKFFRQCVCGGSLQAYVPHPYDNSLNHYLLCDTVHLFKNFYNNLVNRKTFVCPSFQPGGEPFTVQFSHVEMLYQLELGQPLKIAYKLTDKVLKPSKIERSSVQLAKSFFDESTINGLKHYAAHGYPEFLGTAQYLSVIHKWFNVVNVKNPYAADRYKDDSRKAVFKDDYEKPISYLNSFADWLKRWEEMGTAGLSNETFTAAKQTATALPLVALYILQIVELSYLLLGLLQSDYLEGRFGWYRQLCGGNYFNDVLQFLQAEKKIRMSSLIKMGVRLSEIADLRTSETLQRTEAVSLAVAKMRDHMDVSLLDTLTHSPQHIIYYVCGALAHSILNNNKCEGCVPLISPGKQQISLAVLDLESDEPTVEELEASLKEDFVNTINRGGLLKPSDMLYIACHHIWGFYKYIRMTSNIDKLLMESPHPLSVFVALVTEKLEEADDTHELMSAKCSSGHAFANIVNSMAIKMFNTMSKNYVAEQNSAIHASKPRKREADNPKESEDCRKIKKLKSK